MFKFLQDYLWGPSEAPIILEDAYKKLALAEEAENPEQESDDEDVQYQLAHETGTITQTGNNTYEIDNKYKFTSEETFAVGTKVSFTIYKDSHKIINVKEVVDEWGAEPAAQAAGSWFLRTIIVHVSSKIGRKLMADPGSIEIDLNQTKSEFVPIVGDYLELEAKIEKDPNVLNFSGKILEIVKVRPVRAQMKEGSIKKFNDKEYTGVINKDIWFNKEALLNGYIPKMGDKVVVEIIESNQGDYLWRAVKVLLQSAAKSPSSNQFGNLNKLPKYLHCKDGVRISDNVNIKSNNFHESHAFTLSVTNEKYDDVTLKDLTIEGTMNQTRFQGVRAKNQVLKPNETVKFNFSVAHKSFGKSQEYILFHFDDVIVGRVVTIVLEGTQAAKAPGNANFASGDKLYNSMKRSLGQQYVQAVRGEPIRAPPRFQMRRLNEWRIPKSFCNLYFKYDDLQSQKHNFAEELLKSKPNLGEALTLVNYEERFHTLVFLEELYHILAMRKYDIGRACFIEDGEFLILEMPGLAESRPSIIVGDRVTAICLSSNNHYEGFVHHSMSNHLKLKFTKTFHQDYKGEDYEVRVVASRRTFKREHEAIYRAVKSLGELLFPNRVFKKNAQVKFTYDPYEDTLPSGALEKKTIEATPAENHSKVAASTPKSNGTRRDLVRKMNAMMEKNKAAASNSEANDSKREGKSPVHRPMNNRTVFKLEWHDKSLNYFQKEAVRNILLGESRPLPYIIFGPPGTGKTVTIIECILQILRMVTNARILIATPSNNAANLLTIRLINSGVILPGDLVRLVSYRVVHDGLIPDCIRPYSATASIAREGTTAEENCVAKDGYVHDMTSTEFARHKVIIGTCNALGALQHYYLKKGHFTHIIIDEAGQCTEPEIMIPLCYVDDKEGQIIIAGDPMQLGPVVLSDDAKAFGLEQTFLDRLIIRFPYIRDSSGFPNTGGYDPRLVTKLLYNYRAMPELLVIPSNCFYHNDLRPTISETDSDEARFLNKLADMLPNSNGRVPSLVFHGINGKNQRGDDMPSWYNLDEASQVFYYINQLYRLGVKSSDIGIITPYVKQVRQIRQMVSDAEFVMPKVGTVEEFQGLEYKIIILSIVRSCSDDLNFDKRYVLGFISNPRRFNVALTRSQCLTIVIGNPHLLQLDNHWNMVLSHCRNNNAYVGCELK